MKNPIKEKVDSLFREIVGERVEQIHVIHGGNAARRAIANALSKELSDETAADVAFHLTDWASDAAFLTAILIFPERFSPEEIRQGITNFLAHVPDHVAAAAHLDGWEVRDVFEVGMRIKPPTDD